MQTRRIFLTLTACIAAMTSLASAQGLPSVITMQTGLQFEGQHVLVPGVSETLSDLNPLGTNNVLMIDDGLRFNFVNARRVINQVPSDRVDSEFRVWQKESARTIGGANSLISTTPFDDYGHRILTVSGKNGPLSYVQGITKITPRYIVVDALVGNSGVPTRSWEMSLGMNMISPDIIRTVLRSQINQPDNPDEHLAIVDFFIQAQQFDRANDELRLIQQRFPELREEIDNSRQIVRQQNARQVLREIRLQMESGSDAAGEALGREF